METSPVLLLERADIYQLGVWKWNGISRYNVNCILLPLFRILWKELLQCRAVENSLTMGSPCLWMELWICNLVQKVLEYLKHFTIQSSQFNWWIAPWRLLGLANYTIQSNIIIIVIIIIIIHFTIYYVRILWVFSLSSTSLLLYWEFKKKHKEAMKGGCIYNDMYR